MKARYLAGALAIAIAAPATAQTSSGAQTASSAQITLYELPAYLGRSVTVTAATTDLATQQFAARAQSARVTGEWQVCGQKDYGGSCRTLTANQPYLAKATAVSLRPAGATATAAATTTTGTAATGTTATAALNLDALDAGAGTDGQDVTFYATPQLSGTQIAAGTNDLTTATAFCKLAGASSALSAGRARVQASGLIDLSAKANVRAFALRDVVCRK